MYSEIETVTDLLADASQKASNSLNLPILEKETQKLLVNYNALGQAIHSENYS